MSNTALLVPPRAGEMTAEYVGIDVGGTKVMAASLCGDDLGAPLLRPVGRGSAEATIRSIVDAVERLRTSRTAAVGVGFPSPIEWSTGRVHGAVNLPLVADLPLRDILRERIGLPVHLDNDAACAALAEAYDGDRLLTESLVMFTVGTGVGGGIVLGGRIYRGATGATAELGHTMISMPHGGAGGALPRPGASFPQPGSLESFGAGPVLDVLAADAGRSDPESLLGQLSLGGREIRGPEAVMAAQAGDPAARRVVEQIGRWLGVGIANAINMLDPEQVVVGGGVCAAGELLLAPAREVASSLVLPGVGLRTTVRCARHREQAGVRGAAMLAAQEHAAERGAV